jgi:serine/threonine protein phosphatase PrpC
MAYVVGIQCALGVGPERGGRKRNEDNFLVIQGGSSRRLGPDGNALEDVSAVPGLLVAVLDGMGGLDNGHLASSSAARALAGLQRSEVPRDPERAHRRFVMEQHKRLHREAKERGPVAMGTTVTAVWLISGVAAWVSVGDSRCYLWRGERLVQLSRDQTRSEFARRDGLAFVGPDHLVQSFLFGSRGLGDNSALRLDPGLDTGTLALEPGDRLILVTDGVWSCLEPDALAAIAASSDDPNTVALGLLDAAIAAGATDNVTAAVVRVDAVPDRPERSGDDEDDEKTWAF